VIKVAQRVKKEVGIVTVIINCCNLPSPRVLTEHPAPDICEALDIGVMSQFWVSLKDWCVILLGEFKEGIMLQFRVSLEQ
jgi:hypothetical protein